MEDLDALGLSPPPGWGESRDDKPTFEVWPENWEAVVLFCRLSTQWKLGAFGGFIGLDYVAVDATMRLLKIRQRERLFGQIQLMESAALAVLNLPLKKSLT